MRLAVLALALAASPAAAQVAYPPADNSAAQAKADAALATAATAQQLAQQACQPMALVPPPETVGGSAGSGTACRLVTAIQPRITRTASCAVTIAGGIASCTTSWEGGSFPTGTTIRLAGAPAIVDTVVGGTSEQPITCKAYAMTVTGVSFRCWQGLATTVSALGATVLPFAAPAQSATVQVTAIPSS